MEGGIQSLNTITSLHMIWTPKSGMTLIFTMTSQDGTTALSWLKLFHHGNTLYSVVKLETSLKEAQGTSETP